MDIIKDIYLDFYDKSQSSVSAKESDNGRYIRAVVTAGGKEYQIPEGVKAYLASGNVYRVCKIENNRILAGLTPEMLTPGHYPAQIELMSSDKKLTSMSFSLLVEPSARFINAEQSDGKLDLLDVLIQEATEGIEKAEGAVEATEAANEAAAKANQAATAASTAKTNADTATIKTNQAATAANQAAERANDAAANAEQFEVNKKTVTFAEASNREPLESGDTVEVLFGKTKKWCTDLENTTIKQCGMVSDLSLLDTFIDSQNMGVYYLNGVTIGERVVYGNLMSLVVYGFPTQMITSDIGICVRSYRGTPEVWSPWKIILASETPLTETDFQYSNVAVKSVATQITDNAIRIYKNKYECKVTGAIKLAAGSYASDSMLLSIEKTFPKTKTFAAMSGSITHRGIYVDKQGIMCLNGNFTLGNEEYFYLNFSVPL